MTRERWLTPLDRQLLDELARAGSLVDACEALGIGRDRGVYRLRRLREITGHSVVEARRGGASGGTSRLTPTGERLRRMPTGPIGQGGRAEPGFRGTFSSRGGPHVRIAGGVTLAVGFDARDGESVRLILDPESVLVARERFATSARNVLLGRVAEIRPRDARSRLVVVCVGPLRIQAAVTPRSIEELGLRPRARVYLYVKATALRPGGAPA
ncbi:MAG TPA: TOBE domain-containing protein [Thermoplasmata archaeon]|nr:TOBE domain-containing protein [Thermoplasmata archaeon]